MTKPLLSPFDALDAALSAFRATRAVECDVSEDDPMPDDWSHQEPPPARVAPAVAPLKTAENCHCSTGATRATSNHKIQLPEKHSSDKTNVSLHCEPGVARSLSSQVVPVALVDKPQKSACFTGATAGATSGSSGTMAVFCGFLPPAGGCETFSEAISEVPELPEPLQSHSKAAEPIDNLPADLQVIFDERAAIAEFNGGLSRDLAEDVARTEMAAGPVGDDVTAWRSWVHSRVPIWRARGLSGAALSQGVWSEAEGVWHLRHHPVADPDRCAGCGEWMLDGPGMRMLDGAVIHFGNPDRLDCLILYGEAWRGAASAALMAFGLKNPHLVQPEGAAP